MLSIFFVSFLVNYVENKVIKTVSKDEVSDINTSESIGLSLSNDMIDKLLLKY